MQDLNPMINQAMKEIIADEGIWVEKYKDKVVVIKPNYNRLGEIVDYSAQWENDPLSKILDEEPNNAWRDLTQTY